MHTGHFAQQKILAPVVSWELLAQNYSIFRNPKIFKIYFSQSTSLKKRKIENISHKTKEYSIFQNGILKIN
jgi:hypothetical protein